MKKIAILIFFLLIFTSWVEAQPKTKLVDNWHLNVNVGPTIFLGDVTQYFDKLKTDFSTPKLSFGINLTKEFTCAIAVRGQLGYGWLAGQKNYYAGGSPANLSFTAHFYHFNGQLKINFIDLFAGGKCFRKVNFYGFAGIGFINFQNRLYRDGVEVLSWGFNRSGTYRWVTEITVPYGLGIDVRFGPKWRLNLEAENIWVNSEKVDRVVGMYKYDQIIYPSIGVSYNISKYNRVCCKSNKPIYTENKADNKKVNNDKNPDVKADNVSPKIDTLTKNMTHLLDNTKSLNDKVNKLQGKIDSLKNRKDTIYIVKNSSKRDTVYIVNNTSTSKRDTIYIVKEITNHEPHDIQYPDSVNKLLQGAGYLIYNVYFDLDKYNIKEEYQKYISQVADVMKMEPGLKIRVVGNADQQGKVDHNVILSKNRAQAVINEMVNKYGVDRNRLIIDYKGDREPISRLHFEVNRRVDFIRVQK